MTRIPHLALCFKTAFNLAAQRTWDVGIVPEMANESGGLNPKSYIRGTFWDYYLDICIYLKKKCLFIYLIN